MSRAELDETAAIMAAEFGSAGSTYTPLATSVTVAINPVMTYGSRVIDNFGGYELLDRAKVSWNEYSDEPVQGDSLDVGAVSYTVDAWEPLGSSWDIILRRA